MIEFDDDFDYDMDMIQYEDDTNLDQIICCPKCFGTGCNYCLMLEN